MFKKSILFATLTIALSGLGFMSIASAVDAGESEPRESLTLSPVNKKYAVDAGKTIDRFVDDYQ